MAATVDGSCKMRSPHTLDERLHVDTLGGVTIMLVKPGRVAVYQPIQQAGNPCRWDK